MDFGGNDTIVLLVLLELAQLLAFWFFVRRRRASLRQLGRLTGQLAEGAHPASYYVDGPPLVARLTGDLEKIGARLDALQRRQQEEDFNLNVLLANMVEGVMVVDRRHIVRLVNDELLNLFDLKSSPLNRTVLESLREARVELIVREALAKNEVQQGEVALQGGPGPSPRHLEVSAVPIRTGNSESGGVRARLPRHHPDQAPRGGPQPVRGQRFPRAAHAARHLPGLSRDDPGPSRPSRRRAEADAGGDAPPFRAAECAGGGSARPDPVRVEADRNRAEPDPSRRLFPPARRRLAPAALRQRHGSGALHPGRRAALEVDPLRFEQVILNLLENAVAYSNPPRRIVISVRPRESEMEVRVADNGIGIPPADLPHIFERFYRVDKGRSRVSGGTASAFPS